MAPSQFDRMDPRRGSTASAVMDELAYRIETYVAGKAWGRVRDLHVVCTENLIILQGRTRTHHDKQLAQEAVFDVADQQAELANQIVVGC